MTIMAKPTDAELRNAILRVLSETQKDYPLEEVINLLRESETLSDDSAVKSAIWQLILQRDLELTDERTLRRKAS